MGYNLIKIAEISFQFFHGGLEKQKRCQFLKFGIEIMVKLQYSGLARI